MRIENIDLRELRMRLKAPFETSSEVTWDRRILLVEVGVDGMVGWGEITAAEDPFFNGETTDTAWHIFQDFMVPLVLGRSVEHASEIHHLLAPIRGHEMTKAGLENAVWDIEAQQKGVPLAKLLGGTREEIPCGVSIGIQDSITTLLAKVEVELRAGYQRVKMKIKPGKDVDFVAAARRQYPDAMLMVDANSAYQLKDASHLKCLDEYDLMMIEQPLAWDDIYQHARLQAQLRTPLCLDECIRNSDHAEAAINLKACCVINIKLGRVGGHTMARQVHDVARRESVPIWCGGMLESGIGRAHNIAMSALPGFVLPGDVSASQRYWDQDIIEPEVEVSRGGDIRVPTEPGLGYAIRHKRIETLTVRSRRWSATAMSRVSVKAHGGRIQSAMSSAEVNGEIAIREVEPAVHLKEIEGLEREVWGLSDIELVPASLLVAAREAGGVILGAFDGPLLVGFVFGFLGQEDGKVTLHSHTMAVRSTYRDRGLGYRLKLAQREAALSRGIQQVTWTFDPLESRNAYLNFAKLGVTSDSYKVDFYGDSTSFLHSNGTDRLWVRWPLDTERVRNRVEHTDATRQPCFEKNIIPILKVGPDGAPITSQDVEALQAQPLLFIEIPTKINRKDPSVGRQWRLATREVFISAIRAGFRVCEFYRSNPRDQGIGTYVLCRRHEVTAGPG